MLRRKKTKAAALLAGCAMMAMAVFAPAAVGLHDGCSLVERLLYPFFHANLLHAALNVYVLWSLVFLFDTSAGMLAASYAIAVCYPYGSPSLTVGLSGVVYALMAFVVPQVSNKLQYIAFVSLYILIGFAFPVFNNLLHVWCFVIALVIVLIYEKGNTLRLS